MTEKRFELQRNQQGQADIIDWLESKEKNAICIYNDLGILPFLLVGCDRKVEEKDDYILSTSLDFEVYSSVKLSSLFEELNVELMDGDYTLYFDELGTKEYTFNYKKNEEIKEGKIVINIKDTTKPIVRLGSSYAVEVGYNKKPEVVLVWRR